MSRVKISVIVAINNGAGQLGATLDSIRAQSFRDIEVIMLDAASDDGTADVMKQYLSDKRFSYVYCDSTSISEARNKGIDRARGKYLAFGDSNVIFSRDVFRRLYDCAEKEKAELCVAPMTSTDIYGEHRFSSTGLLSKRRRISKFDADMIWNPAITNKLFLREKVEERGHRFICFGKAREAAFTLAFALKSERVTGCTRGSVCYVAPAVSDGVAVYPIEYYLDGYAYIISHAEEAFDKAINESVTEFDKKELVKRRTYYIDTAYSKLVTVLLYSYYRYFWLLKDEEIRKYAEIITGLVSKLSPGGKGALLKKNRDIFCSGKLIDNKKEMAESPKATVAISFNDKTSELYDGRMETQLSSVYSQTMPCFELLVDGRLKNQIPDKWKNAENLRFVECDGTGDFKNKALSMSRTDYIMYLDGFARLNPKHLMRHYLCLAGKDKYGFSTSPISHYDGEKTGDYSFSDLFSKSNSEQTRVTDGDSAFVLDLFFANKLFRTEHLRGIHFSFSDNAITDMYKLYTHSRFRKLANTGVYLILSEHQAVEYILSESKNMPSGAVAVLKSYKRLVFKTVKLKKARQRAESFAYAITRLIVGAAGRMITGFYSRQKLKNRVLFYSTLPEGGYCDNLDAVYRAYEGEKLLFRKPHPHSLSDVARLRKYILTSRVIVIDCEMEYLRGLRLRKEQKVIQLWHKNGAFRRFGLDKHTDVSPFSEYKNHSQYSDVAVTGEYVRQFYTHAFGIDYDTVKALGTPCTDSVLNKSDNEANREIIRNKHPLLRNRRIFVYFPTFRESEGELKALDPKIDWAELNKNLADDEIFVISRHPLSAQELLKGKFYSRVKDYTKDPTNELLSLADVVITDYSSIIFDASLLGKPMVFYCSDFGEFEPDFYLDYDKDLPGEIVKDSEKLLEAIRRAEAVSTPERVDAFRRKYMESCDGKSTKRIIKLIKSYLA